MQTVGAALPEFNPIRFEPITTPVRREQNLTLVKTLLHFFEPGIKDLAGVNHVTLDGQGKGTIDAPDARQPAVQVLGREITIKGLTVTGGQFGIAINRGATAIVDGNTMQNAAAVALLAREVGAFNSTIRTDGLESGPAVARLIALTSRMPASIAAVNQFPNCLIGSGLRSLRRRPFPTCS